MYSPRGGLLPHAEAVKKVTKLPVIVAGRLCDPKIVVKAVETGRCDVVALCRPLMADPLMPRKMIEGRPDDVRMCVACGYCTTEAGWTVYCSINPEQGRELVLRRIEPAAKPRKILVAGGGPGGMEAARVLRERGHEVTLCEKSSQLGGALRAASAMPLTREWKTFIRWHSQQLEKVGVKVRMNTEVTKKLVEEMRQDAVVIATGASPRVNVKGAGQPNVVTDEDVLLNGIKTGKKVVVVGGAFWDVEISISLADQGKEVTLVRESETISIEELGITRAMPILTGMLQQKKVGTLFSTRVRTIEKNGVAIIDKEGKTDFVEADTVVLSMGRAGNRTLVGELQEVVQELHEVGDCATPGCVADAVLAGRVVGSIL
jgi:NADPH-dependent 2,4-dienoyl-CoA reductase/sulfur reductase-like enzyme